MCSHGRARSCGPRRRWRRRPPPRPPPAPHSRPPTHSSYPKNENSKRSFERREPEVVEEEVEEIAVMVVDVCGAAAGHAPSVVRCSSVVRGVAAGDSHRTAVALINVPGTEPTSSNWQPRAAVGRVRAADDDGGAAGGRRPARRHRRRRRRGAGIVGDERRAAGREGRTAVGRSFDGVGADGDAPRCGAHDGRRALEDGCAREGGGAEVEDGGGGGGGGGGRRPCLQSGRLPRSGSAAPPPSGAKPTPPTCMRREQ